MFQQLRETKRLDSLAELFFNICKFRCQTLLIQNPLVKYICSNSKQVHTLNVSITSSFSLLTVFCSSSKHRWVSNTYEFCILPGRPATLSKNIKLSPFTTQILNYPLFFFRTSWKDGLSKQIVLEYDLSCINRKDDISFSREHDLFALDRKRKTASLSRKYMETWCIAQRKRNRKPDT